MGGDGRMKTGWIAAVIAVGALVCGCALPSERAVYSIAKEAVLARPEVPDDATIPRMKDVEIYVCKNAALVELACEFVDSRGLRMKRRYAVWSRRVARTWTLDRCEPTPGVAGSDAGFEMGDSG